jgi:prophage regulatory protein
MSNTHMLRLEKAGKFPKRIYLGEKSPVWIEREILEWIETKCREREK